MDFPVTDGVTTVVPPPPGYEVDFDNPRQQKVLAHYLVFGIGGPLVLVALCQRYYTKIWLLKGLQLDDAFMLLAWISSVVTQVMLVDSIAKGGMCAHAWEMPLERFEAYSVVTYVTAPVFMLCNGFTKLSLLTFYLHLSPQRWFRIAVWTSIVIVSLYTIIITLMLFFHCQPVRKAFDFKLVGGSCIDAGILYMATAVSNVVTDVILFILPIPMVYNLRLRPMQKLGAILIFGIGSLTLATSIVRLVLLPATLESTDASWDAAPANVWSFVEANLFVICGSMPTLRKFFQHFMPRLMGSSVNDSYAPYERYGPSGFRNSTLVESRSRRLSRRPRDETLMKTFEDNEMQFFVASRDGSGPKSETTETTAVATSETGEADAHSEKAIIQTKTFAIQYE